MAVADGISEQLLALAKSVRKDLLDKNIAKNEVAGPDFISEGLSKLLEMQLLSPGSLTLADVRKAVKAFQKGRGQSLGDGVLRKKLLVRLLSAIDCRDRETHDTSKVKPMPEAMGKKPLTSSADVRKYFIRYFIHPSLPSSFGVRTTTGLIADAWAAWSQHTKFIKFEEVMDAAEANVTIKQGVVPGGGVGLAPVAGPGNFDTLEVLLESSDEWTTPLFQAVASHEFGHVLGLDHSNRADQLMSEIIPRSVKLPEDEDIARIQKIYQARAKHEDDPDDGHDV